MVGQRSPSNLSPASPDDPVSLCLKHLRSCDETIIRSTFMDNLISNARFFIVIAGLASAACGWAGLGLLWWVIAAMSIVSFVGLLSIHERVFHNLAKSKRHKKFIERSLIRAKEGTDGEGPHGMEWVPDNHPCAMDLHLFGKGSLFAAICIAQTRAGHALLAKWFLEQAPANDVMERAEGVGELKNDLDTRLHRIGLMDLSERGIEFDSAIQWGRQSLPAISELKLASAILMAMFNLISLGSWALWGYPLSIFLVGIIATCAVYLNEFRKLRAILFPVRKQAAALGMLAETIKVILACDRNSKILVGIAKAAGKDSAEEIKTLARIINGWQARMNQLFAPIAFLIFWDFFFAKAIARWHAKNHERIQTWVSAVACFEALDSLAHQSFLFQGSTFPEIVDSQSPVISGRNLVHPLIPPDKCVTNDVNLSPPLRCMLISGSNMSGKSTYMRTVGINTILGLAGGAVHASKMTLTPVRVVATLQIQDSLKDGLSRFGAELSRLRQIIELAGHSPPLLFLLDEIFSGTNSRDRLAGARALIMNLVSKSAIGMVTTHDLALTDIGKEMGDQCDNGHFVDQMDMGKMAFDYKLRPGIVSGSNAAGLMRAIGIELVET